MIELEQDGGIARIFLNRPQKVNALDSRILSADERGGQVVAAQDVGIFTDQNCHARWYELSLNGPTPSLLQEGTLSPGAGVDTYMPSAALLPNS